MHGDGDENVGSQMCARLNWSLSHVLETRCLSFSRPERRTCFFLFNYEHLSDNGPRTSCCIEMCINRMRVSSYHSFFRWLRFFFIRYIRWADYARSELWEGVRSLWLGWRIVDESLTFATIFIQWIHLISAAHFSELSFSGSSSRIKHAFKHGFNPIDFSGLPYIYSSWIINEANSELVLNWLLQQWKPSQLVIFTMSNKNTLHSVDFIIVMAWNVSRCGMHCLAFHA